MIWRFIKSHYVLIIIAFLGILLLIKNCSIPFPYGMPDWIKYIFIRPSVKGVSELIDGFVLSYLASVLFYYLASYRPDEKRKVATCKLFKPLIQNLYFNLNEIVSMLEYAKEKQNVEKYSDILYDQTPYYAKKYGGKSSDSELFYIDTDISKCSKKLIVCCEDMFKIPNYAYIDARLSEVIAELFSNTTLRFIMTSNLRAGCQISGADEVVLLMEKCMATIEEYYEFIRYKYVDLSKEELERYKEILEGKQGIIKDFHGKIYYMGCRIRHIK